MNNYIICNSHIYSVRNKVNGIPKLCVSLINVYNEQYMTKQTCSVLRYSLKDGH